MTAKARKKSAKKPATKPAAEAMGGKSYTFISRDKSSEVKMNAPTKGNKASEVVFRVLNKGELPKGLKLQYADSYNAHFINRKGKNACGSFNVKDLLVINGIADELEAAGVKGIIKPTQKSYRAIKVGGYSSGELKALADKIAMVLGITKSKKKEAGAGVPAKVGA